MEKIKITQVKSLIRREERQKRTVKALGLGKLNKSVTLDATPQVMGMVNQVKHLLKVEEA